MFKYLFLIIFIIFSGNIIVCQESNSLVVGNKAPSIVLPTSENTLQGFSFPLNNKIVLLFFWSSSVPTSQKNLFMLSKINSKFSNSEFKSCNGFEMISIALQSDRVAWANDLKKYNLSKLSNCIALQGYNDYFVKSYKLNKSPSSYLIDEFGKIIYVNPDIKTIIGYLSERKNSYINTTNQTSIVGKIVVGDAFKSLKNSKVNILTERKDTLQKTITNDNGVFYVKNINTMQNLSISVLPDNQIQDEDQVFLANESGEVLSIFNNNTSEFRCNIQSAEMQFYKPISELNNDLETPKLTDLLITDYLHKDKDINIDPNNTVKLDEIVLKLKELPKFKVEIISHTTCKGDAKLNLILSEKRAIAIANYFIGKGIEKSRIKTTGKGESNPLNECKDGTPCSQDKLEKNNRTEFNITLVP